MKTKSVIAGEYTAPPAHGPMIAEICGTTPEARVLRRKMSAYPASETTPSWIRAPPESFSPTIGTPVFIARSITLQILDRKSTRLNSSHSQISYAVFCLKKKKKNYNFNTMNVNKEECLKPYSAKRITARLPT